MFLIVAACMHRRGGMAVHRKMWLLCQLLSADTVRIVVDQCSPFFLTRFLV